MATASRTKIKDYDGLYQRSGRIIVAFELLGKTEFEPTGQEVNKANCKLATDKLTVVKGEIIRGTFNYAEHFPSSRKVKKNKPAGALVTVTDVADDWWQAWLNDNKAAKPNTIRDYRTCLERHLKGKLGARPISEIKQADLIEWNNNLKSSRKPYGPLTNSKKGNIHTVASRVFAHAEAAGLFPGRNPWDFFEAYKKSLKGKNKKLKGRKGTEYLEPYTAAERKKILAALEVELESERNMVAFNLGQGLRSGELYALAWEDIDLKARTIEISIQRQAHGWERCKAGSRRILDLSNESYDALMRQKKIANQCQPIEVVVLEDELDSTGENIHTNVGLRNIVFFNSTNNSPFLQSTTFSKKWPLILAGAGVNYLDKAGRERGPNHTRHTFASRLLTAGATYWEISQELGNTEEATRQSYACLIEEDRVSTADKKNKWLAAT